MHKKLFLIILSTLAGHSMLAMEPAEQTQIEKDELGRALIDAVYSFRTNDALELIKKGANVNYMNAEGRFFDKYNSSALMYVVSLGALSPLIRLQLAQELIKAGANVNLINRNRETALMRINPGSGEDFVKCIIQGGLDIYYNNNKDIPTVLCFLAVTGFAQSSELILQIATQLTGVEKASIKNWLLTEQRLRQEGRGLVKDLRKLIAEYVINLYVADLHERVIRTGAPKALGFAHEYASQNAIESTLLENYLDLNFLKRRVRSQLTK